MSYVMQKYIPIEQGTPDWQSSPVPTWGGNPLNAGPRRVGVGCGPGTGCGASEDPYKQVGWGMVAAGAAAALIVGLIIGYAAGGKKKSYAANKKRRKSAVWTRNGKVVKLSTARRERLPAGGFVFPERRAWPIHDRPHAIKALQYAKWPQHKARRSEVLSAVAAEWGGDPEVREKFQEYFPKSATKYLGGRRAAA